MKKYFFLLLISLTLNACNSVPSDKEIQSSIDKNIVFYKGSSFDPVSDSLKSVFIGKKKKSDKEIKIYYSHDGNIYEDINLICLDNGTWIMEKNSGRWEMK